MKKKKPTVSPDAAKILEQYRNAGKPQPAGGTEGSGTPSEGNGTPARPSAPPPSAGRIQRSGNRGK